MSSDIGAETRYPEYGISVLPAWPAESATGRAPAGAPGAAQAWCRSTNQLAAPPTLRHDVCAIIARRAPITLIARAAALHHLFFFYMPKHNTHIFGTTRPPCRVYAPLFPYIILQYIQRLYISYAVMRITRKVLD